MSTINFIYFILKVNDEKILLANYYGLNSDEIYLLEEGSMS